MTNVYEFADMLATEGFFDTLLEFQLNSDDYDPDVFLERLEKEAFNREVKLGDLDHFNYDDYWWALMEEAL